MFISKKHKVKIYHISLVYTEINDNVLSTALRMMTTSVPVGEEEAINYAIDYFKDDEDLKEMILANKVVLEEYFYVEEKSIHYTNSQKHIQKYL